MASGEMEVFCGGKGLNQSIALARAGVPAYHAGMIGEDGEMFLDICRENGVDTRYIRRIPGKNGHTIIQVDRKAQNSILLYGGSNRALTREWVDGVLEEFGQIFCFCRMRSTFWDILWIRLTEGACGSC